MGACDRTRQLDVARTNGPRWPAPIALETTMKDPVTLTTLTGAPIGMQQALTAGPRGPLMMQDVQLLEQLQHFNRERIPERVVHAKGSGAYGTFTVTKDVTKHTCAAFLGAVG